MNHKSEHMSKKSLANNQQGLVSFVVTIIIMLLLSLIIIGFARLSRREQRQSLDRQLSTQAFYAAEAGVNDAVNALETNVLDDTTSKEDCDAIPGYDNVLNTTGPISYTCVLVDPTPTEFTYDAINQNGSEIVKVQSSTGSLIDTINIFWQDKDGRTGLACPDIELSGLPQSWPVGCDTGILRVDLIPYSTGANPSRTDLIISQMTSFLYPAGAGPNLDYGSAANLNNQGKMTKGNCNAANTPRYCRVTITGISSNRFYLRLKGIYGTSAVTINSFSLGSAVEMSGGQAVIDSTGKANDVLRRIKVTVPYGSNSGQFAEFAAESGATLCKRFTVSDIIGVTIAPANTTPECEPRQP